MNHNEACYYLFVYGSLRKGFDSPAYEYIREYFKYIGPATVGGKLFDCGEFPAAIPSDDGSQLMGELYCIKHEHSFSYVIAQLDDYEGIGDVDREQDKYYRSKCISEVGKGVAHISWIYWYKGDVNGCTEIASGDIFDFRRN